MVPSLPANFKAEKATVDDFKLVGIALGWSMGFAFLTGAKAARQTYDIWHRTHGWRNVYVWLIWAELLDNVTFAIYTWLMIDSVVPFGFTFCLTIVTLWVIQIQLLPQIILNRISLIAVDKRLVTRLKILVFIFIALINISVYTIWIPARMEISQKIIRVNNIWDRLEKVIYAIIDLSLNLYFLYLVRTRLMSAGLAKYNRLFWFNATIVWVSISMDILIIGMMSLSDTLIYVQFHPIAYLAKLHIEMTMADLIAKVASSTLRDRVSAPRHPGNASSGSKPGTWPQPKPSAVGLASDNGSAAAFRLDSKSNGNIELANPAADRTVSTEGLVRARGQRASWAEKSAGVVVGEAARCADSVALWPRITRFEPGSSSEPHAV